MNNILIFSQDGTFTGFCRSIGIGKRQDSGLIGEKLTKMLEIENMTSDDLIKKIGSSYRETVKRVLSNEEIPSRKFIEKLLNMFELPLDYFTEKNLENVIVTDNGIIVARYETNERAKEVKNELDKLIRECHFQNKPIILEMPKI